MEFKSERDKINYYKRKELRDLNTKQENVNKIAEAYHEVEFGVVPEVADNRSIAEREQDTREQTNQAQRNVLMLMNNDGTEANTLIQLIGSANYVKFNRYFLDIYNGLKNQVGKIRAVEAHEFIKKYIDKTEKVNGVDIPNQVVLEELINKIREFEAGGIRGLRDILLRLEALEAVLRGGVRPEAYEASDLPRSEDIKEMTETISTLDVTDDKKMDDTVYDLAETVKTVEKDTLESVMDSLIYDDDDVIEPMKGLKNDKYTKEEQELLEFDDDDDEDYIEEVDLMTDDEIDKAFRTLKNKTSNIASIPEKMRYFQDDYDFVINNINKPEDTRPPIKDLRKKLHDILFIIGIKKLGNPKKYDKLYEQFQQHEAKLRQFNNILTEVKDEENMISDDVKDALDNLDSRLSVYEGTDAEKAKGYITSLDRLRKLYRLDKDKYTDKDRIPSQYRADYNYVVHITRGIEGKKSSPLFKNLDVLNKEPYNTIYNKLVNEYGAVAKSSSSSYAEEEKGSNVHTLSEYTTSTSGKGLKGMYIRGRLR